MQIIDTALGCLSGVKGEHLLIKTHVLVTQKLEMTWKQLSCSLSFTFLEDTMKAASREKQFNTSIRLWYLWATQLSAWQHVTHNSAISGPHMLNATNSYLTRLRPIQQEGNLAWYWDSSNLPETSKEMVLRRASTASTLLDQHNT